MTSFICKAQTSAQIGYVDPVDTFVTGSFIVRPYYKGGLFVEGSNTVYFMPNISFEQYAKAMTVRAHGADHCAWNLG